MNRRIDWALYCVPTSNDLQEKITDPDLAVHSLNQFCGAGQVGQLYSPRRTCSRWSGIWPRCRQTIGRVSGAVGLVYRWAGGRAGGREGGREGAKAGGSGFVTIDDGHWFVASMMFSADCSSVSSPDGSGSSVGVRRAVDRAGMDCFPAGDDGMTESYNAS